MAKIQKMCGPYYIRCTLTPYPNKRHANKKNIGNVALLIEGKSQVDEFIGGAVQTGQ